MIGFSTRQLAHVLGVLLHFLKQAGRLHARSGACNGGNGSVKMPHAGASEDDAAEKKKRPRYQYEFLEACEFQLAGWIAASPLRALQAAVKKMLAETAHGRSNSSAIGLGVRYCPAPQATHGATMRKLH